MLLGTARPQTLLPQTPNPPSFLDPSLLSAPKSSILPLSLPSGHPKPSILPSAPALGTPNPPSLTPSAKGGTERGCWCLSQHFPPQLQKIPHMASPSWREKPPRSSQSCPKSSLATCPKAKTPLHIEEGSPASLGGSSPKPPPISQMGLGLPVGGGFFLLSPPCLAGFCLQSRDVKGSGD